MSANAANLNAQHKLAYTVAEACEATGLSDDTLYRRHATGMITMKKIGRRTLILKADLDLLLANADNLARRAS